MIMCSNCKKRPAVVFITSIQGNEKKNEGLCLICAKEKKIPNVKEYMERLGISDEEAEQLSEQMMNMLDGDAFQMGGSGLFPDFLSDAVPEEDAEDFMKFIEKTGVMPSGESARPKKRDNPEKEKRSSMFRKEKKAQKELKFLGSYCTNLSRKAEEGQLDKIIGRDKEIARVIQILSRRTKNNPCLIGEPGVGKTAVAEGIAQRISEGNVPFNLADKKLYLLDLTALVAGTQFRGQFESRVKGLVDEVKREGNIILFIDEVHNLVGAGDSEGSMNAANILKPALSRVRPLQRG